MGESIWLRLVAASLCLVCGCWDASVPQGRHWRTHHDGTEAEQREPEEEPTFGWDLPITTANAGVIVGTPLGNATEPIAGHTLRELVTDADVHVRGDGKACVSCHEWASSDTRASFCARVPAFIAQPTSKGDGTDPPNAKPTILKDLLAQWRNGGCR